MKTNYIDLAGKAHGVFARVEQEESSKEAAEKAFSELLELLKDKASDKPCQ